MGKRDKTQGFAFYIDGQIHNFNKDVDVSPKTLPKTDYGKDDLRYDIERVLADTFATLEEGELEAEEILEILISDLLSLRESENE